MSKSDVYTFVDVLIAGGICELYIKNESTFVIKMYPKWLQNGPQIASKPAKLR